MPSLPIPKTSPKRYISFKHALNLRYPDEDTGEWHFFSAFFGDPEISRKIPLAGEHEEVNTNPSLGDFGVRDMAEVMKSQNISISSKSVFVADHYRAIADLAMIQLYKNKVPTIASNPTINQWLDTEAQILLLREKYLLPLRKQLSGGALEKFEQWIQTIHFE